MIRSMVIPLCIAAGFGSVVLAAPRPAAVPPTQWHQWNRASFSTDRSEFAKRTISITPTDMLVQYWNKAVEGDPDGILLLTEHKFIAVKGLDIEPNDKIAPLVNALIDYLLVVRLLELSLPEGPASVDEYQELSTEDAERPIQISAPGVRVIFPPPWRIDGQIRALQLNSLSYRLQLIVGASATARETFEGTIEFVSELTSEYSPAMALEGWKVFRIDEVQTFHLGNEGVEYWATELPSVDTLGDLRANSK